MEMADELLKQTSIIVCTTDRLTDLEECLKSLQPFRAAVAEIIVVNNGPHLAAVEQVAQRHRARVVTEPQRGVSRARNAGVRTATGNILAFLDDDSVADPNWLPFLLAPFRDSQVLAVAGSVFAQSLADPVSQAFDYLHRAQFPKSQLTVDGNTENGFFPMRSALVGNANMSLRREAFRRFGYFDTRLGRGTRIGSGEEPDFLLRVLLGGGRMVVEPAARILHRHSTEWRAVRRWAFDSGCAHTAILTKYFLQKPSLRSQILRYVASRVRRRTAPEVRAAANLKVPRIPLLLGSLFGPIAFLLAGKE
ncbi:MAG TPA: glycosyltransferase [Terriglobia bacterium]|nr:glycosyltransferase [Terriglobia bacterium]